MEILLINPFPEDAFGINEATVEPPLGLAYLAAYLEQFGHMCQIIDANVLKIPPNDIFRYISLKSPDIIGISANIITCKGGFKIAKILKNVFSRSKVIMGGPYPSVLSEYCLSFDCIDAVVVGEGEITLKEIADRLSDRNNDYFKDIPGVTYRLDGSIIKNRQREMISNLDLLPMPAYHLLPPLNIYKTRARKKPVGAIFTSRGCPYQCIYCNRSIFGYKIRYRSPDNIIKEIDWLVNKFNIKQLDILDDNFTMDWQRTIDILDKIIERDYELYINLQGGIRVDRVDEQLFIKLKKAGVYKLGFGVESGDQHILSTVKKNIDLGKAIEANNLAKKCGIITYGFFMLGLPGDNAQTMQRTIDFAKKMDPDIGNFVITVPLPGTELYEKVRKEGRFLIDAAKGVNIGFYGGKVFYELEGMNKELILGYYKKAYKQFYFRPKKILQMLLNVASLSELKWLFDATIVALKVITSRKK